MVWGGRDKTGTVAPPLPPTHPAPQQTDALPLVWPYHNAPHESYILLLRRAYVVVITYKLHASHTSLRVLGSKCTQPPLRLSAAPHHIYVYNLAVKMHDLPAP